MKTTPFEMVFIIRDKMTVKEENTGTSNHAL